VLGIVIYLAPPRPYRAGRRRWRVLVLVIILVFAGWLIERGFDLPAVVGAVTALAGAAGTAARRVVAAPSRRRPPRHTRKPSP
jgi:hypothetical protein